METEKKPQAKKEWTKPELIILVRSKPEEAVLTACKWTANWKTAGCLVDICGDY